MYRFLDYLIGVKRFEPLSQLIGISTKTELRKNGSIIIGRIRLDTIKTFSKDRLAIFLEWLEKTIEKLKSLEGFENRNKCSLWASLSL